MVQRATLLVTLTWLLTWSVNAQAQTVIGGSIRGQVKDAQGAVLPGVTVTATSPDTPGRSTVTDGTGTYRLVDLLPATYRLAAEIQGFSSFIRPNVVARAGLNLSIDIVMEIGGLEQTVEVKADTPMLEAGKPGQALNISGDFQRALPITNTRDWSDFLGLTPGVVNIQLSGTNRYVYYLRGSSADAHVIQVDGADMGSFRQNMTSYVNFSTEAIADVQVTTAGADASSPLGVGVVINVATASGTNRLSGAVGAIYTPQRWNGNNLPSGTPATSKVFQPTLSVGGPILKDRLWFFGAYEYAFRETGISRSSKQLSDLQAIQPGFQPFNNENRLNYHFYKVNGRVGEGVQYQAFYQRELSPEETNRAPDGGKYRLVSFGGQALGGRVSAVLGSSTILRVQGSFNDKGLNPSLSIWNNYQGQGPAVTVFNGTRSSAGLLVGDGFLASLNNAGIKVLSPASKITIQADATHYRVGWIGTHEFQAGVFMQPRLRSSTSQFYDNGGFALESAVLRQPGNPAGGYVPFFQRTYDVEQQTLVNISGRDVAVYLQDSWKPVPRITVSAGLRVDWLKFTDHLTDAVSMDSKAVGPRVGAIYVLTKDARNIVRASWSRVHAAVSSAQFNPGVASAGAGFTDRYDLNLDGVFETTRITPGFTRVSTTRTVDPNRHLPFVDEWLVGYRRQFPGQMSLDASFVRRRYRDIIATVEYNGIYEGGVFRGYRDESRNDVYLLTNNTWNWVVNSGLELTATKRTARLQLSAAYTRSFRHLAGTWQPNDPASFIQPTAFPNDKGLTGVTGSATNSLSADASEAAPWLDHVAQLGVVYRAPWNLLLAANYHLQSGAYSGPITKVLPAPDPRFGPSTVTLSNGRKVTNPLATTLRFANSTRGDGQFRGPNVQTLNLRAGRNFVVGPRRIELAFDVLNVMNNAIDTQFLFGGGNQLGSVNFGRNADGTFKGTARQYPRVGQLSVRFVF